jgi:hypothetical protein
MNKTLFHPQWASPIHSFTCLPVPCRMWVCSSYIYLSLVHVYLTWSLLESRNASGREYKRSPGSPESHLTCNPLFLPCACPRTWKTSFEDTGWWLTLCGIHNPGTKRYTSSSKHGKGTKSPFKQGCFSTVKILCDLSFLVEFALEVVGNVVCFYRGSSLSQIGRILLTHLGAASRTNPSHLVPIPYWLNLLLAANHPKGSLHAIKPHLVLKAMKNKTKTILWYLL